MNVASAAVTITVALLYPAAVGADRPDKPNFTGEWRLDAQASDFAGRPGPTQSVLNIEHKEPVIRLTRTLITAGGNATIEARYLTDGKETTNKVPGGRDLKNYAKWDGSGVLITTPLTFGCSLFSIQWRWTLSADGKTLTAVRTFGSGEAPQTEIYRRE